MCCMDFVSHERAQTLGKVGQDLIETCGENIDCVSATHRRWLGKDIHHSLGIDQNPRRHKCPRGCKVNVARDKQEQQHLVVEFGLGFPGLVGSQLEDNHLGLLLHQLHLVPPQFQKGHGIEGFV